MWMPYQVPVLSSRSNLDPYSTASQDNSSMGCNREDCFHIVLLLYSSCLYHDRMTATLVRCKISNRSLEPLIISR